MFNYITYFKNCQAFFSNIRKTFFIALKRTLPFDISICYCLQKRALYSSFFSYIIAQHQIKFKNKIRQTILKAYRVNPYAFCS